MSTRSRVHGGPRPAVGAAPVHPRISFLMWRDSAHPEGGGSELFVERIAEHLAAAGWRATICAAHVDGAARDEVRRGVHVRRRGGRFGVYGHGLLYLLTPAGRRSDIVVDVQNGVPFFAPLVRRHGVVNVVHHVHHDQWAIIFPPRVARVGWWLESRLAPRLYRRCPYVTVSEATRRDLVALGVDADRISIVRNGLDDPAPTPRAERADRPTVCVLSRLVPHKQVEHALAAAAAARASVPELRIEVVGDGWWREALEQRAVELELGDAVTFHGHVPDAERDRILDRSWLLLAPSVKEGWGIAIMEAAAHGVPAIAYRSAGGVCESIVDGETGVLVDEPDELAKRTEELLRDCALRERMSAAARARAASFDWGGTGRRFAAVLTEVAPRSAR